MAFHDPFSTTQPGFAARTNKVSTPTVYSSANPDGWWGPNIQFPYPTNAWFQDFVIPGNQNMIDAHADRRTTVWPYMVRSANQELNFCIPFIRKYPDGRTLRNEHQINYDATATNWGWTSDQSPAIWRYLDLSFGATESMTDWYLDRYDELTATLKWLVNGSQYMEAPIVKGSPYVTMRYTGLTPKFSTDNTDYHAIETVNGAAPGGTVSGTRFEVKVKRPYLGTNATETWVLYSSSSITFTTTTQSLTATGVFTGYLRAAYVPGGTAAAATALDSASGVVPIGGTSSVSVSGDTATTSFTYQTLGGSNLLQYILPHHDKTLSSPAKVSGLTVTTIRGTLSAVTGTTWVMTNQLSTVSWNSPNAIDATKMAAIQTALDTEKTMYAYNLDATEAYLFGKQISRAARLALIADQLGDTAARDSIVASMKSYLNPWFDRDANVDLTRSLLFDTSWGGVIDMGAYNVSPAGDPLNANQGFGNAVYNDHYFHWGYFIYGAAVVAHFDAAWSATYRVKVNDMVRDIANPSKTDPYFTQLRHFDWYEGHSWAAGLQPNGDGRNQESTSEAVNAWYGINLWGLATGQNDMRNVGRYLQALETQAAQLYWQMPSYNTVYPSDFAQQKVIPLLFANKAFNGTWFGLSNDIQVGIEMMPFTPASHELLPKTWMQETYPAILQSVASTSTAHTPGGWLGYTYSAQAIIDSTAAFNNIQALSITNDNQYIDAFGSSKTNLLWWSAVQGSSTSAVATTVSLAASPASTATQGSSVSLTATVTPSAAAGTVTFRNGATTIATATVSGGTASTITTSLPTGTSSLTAVFTPADTGAYVGSTSNTISYTITAVVPPDPEPSTGGVAGSNLVQTAYMSGDAFVALTEARVGVNDANYAATSKETIIAFTALSAARTVTLPNVPVGTQIIVKDEAGSCSATNTITLSGTVNGQANVVLSQPFATATLVKTVNGWTRL